MATGTQARTHLRCQQTCTQSNRCKHSPSRLVNMRFSFIIQRKPEFTKGAKRYDSYLLCVAAANSSVVGLERNVAVVQLRGPELSIPNLIRAVTLLFQEDVLA